MAKIVITGSAIVLKSDLTLDTLKKLKISCIGGKWRLNEVTKAQRELFEALGVNIQ